MTIKEIVTDQISYSKFWTINHEKETSSFESQKAQLLVYMSVKSESLESKC